MEKEKNLKKLEEDFRMDQAMEQLASEATEEQITGATAESILYWCIRNRRNPYEILKDTAQIVCDLLDGKRLPTAIDTTGRNRK